MESEEMQRYWELEIYSSSFSTCSGNCHQQVINAVIEIRFPLFFRVWLQFFETENFHIFEFEFSKFDIDFKIVAHLARASGMQLLSAVVR
jgi:hypothetical protein